LERIWAILISIPIRGFANLGRKGNLKCLPAGKPFLVSGIALNHRYTHDGHKNKKEAPEK
jgi:hypothetical protein